MSETLAGEPPSISTSSSGCRSYVENCTALRETRLQGAHGASCTETSRTTNATKLAPNSPQQPWISCATRSPEIGPTYAIRSQITFASFRRRIFGSWRELGIRSRISPWRWKNTARRRALLSSPLFRPAWLRWRSAGSNRAGRAERLLLESGFEYQRNSHSDSGHVVEQRGVSQGA